MLGRKKVELAKQNDRLLSLYLEGHVEAGTYQDKSTTLQGQIREVDTAVNACGDIDPACRDMALRTFDFTQSAVEVWRGSNHGRQTADSASRIFEPKFQ